jgi:hypothetical protein
MRGNRGPGERPATGFDSSRRRFLAGALAAAGAALLPRGSLAVGGASQIALAQLAYSGGNWQPRPTALRRLAWEIHKRTAVNTALEPIQVKADARALAQFPFLYVSGDRPFDDLDPPGVEALGRFARLGGTVLVDPAFTADGDAKGFAASIDRTMARALPGIAPAPIAPSHVLFRAFYELPRASGRVAGSPGFTGYDVGGRLAVIRGDHDLGGAWARDNLGNWEHEVTPGGERQRENAFRLGINVILFTLCRDYKNEEPHRRFGGGAAGEER